MQATVAFLSNLSDSHESIHERVTAPRARYSAVGQRRRRKRAEVADGITATGACRAGVLARGPARRDLIPHSLRLGPVLRLKESTLARPKKSSPHPPQYPPQNRVHQPVQAGGVEAQAVA